MSPQLPYRQFSDWKDQMETNAGWTAICTFRCWDGQVDVLELICRSVISSVEPLTISVRSGPKVKGILCCRSGDLEGDPNTRDSAPADRLLAIAIALRFVKSTAPGLQSPQ